MKVIKDLVNRIDEELADAQHYAEMSVYKKSSGRNEWASKFHKMANDELDHANVIHQYAVEKIEELNKVYQPSQDMLDKWEKSHKDYVDKAAWIKTMLEM